MIDHFADASGQYLVMEFIPGPDLAALLEDRGAPFGVREVLGWAEQLLRVLEYLHTRQPPVLHRDIKPQNLKISGEGVAVLLDFGLARGDPSLQSQVSVTGSVFGYTAHYAPLEQIHNSGTDARSDLYALAATLHHLLTGATPADAISRATAVLRRQPDPLRPPTAINPRVPPAVSRVLMGALALMVVGMTVFGSGRLQTCPSRRWETSPRASTALSSSRTRAIATLSHSGCSTTSSARASSSE